MLELLFCCGIALAVNLIFQALPTLEPYSNYTFWIFIATIIIFGISLIVKLAFTIKDIVTDNERRYSNTPKAASNRSRKNYVRKKEKTR